MCRNNKHHLKTAASGNLHTVWNTYTGARELGYLFPNSCLSLMENCWKDREGGMQWPNSLALPSGHTSLVRAGSSRPGKPCGRVRSAGGMPWNGEGPRVGRATSGVCSTCCQVVLHKQASAAFSIFSSERASMWRGFVFGRWYSNRGLHRWLSDKQSACKCKRCKRHGFDPWVRKIPWRRKWEPTPVLLPGKSHGQRSLDGYSPWGHQESDRTERTHMHFSRVG